MSGYLARLAARAGGAPAAAGPRLPSRFEHSATDGPTDAETRDAPAQDRHGSERRAEARTEHGAPAATGTRAVAAPPAPGDGSPRGADTETPTPAPPTVAPVHTRPAAGPDRNAPGDPPATAAPRVEAAPPPRSAPRPAAAAHRDEAAAPATETDVVHVTIQRIEVRATVAAAPPIIRSAPQRSSTEQSLHDYLAGKSR